jgi:Tfp pilus assembly protein PilF
MGRTTKRRADPELEALLEAAGQAYERGDLTATLERADAAIARDPRSVEALHYRAAALVECELLNEAAETYERALGIDPDDLEVLHGAAGLYIDRAQADDRDVEWLGQGLDLATRGQRLWSWRASSRCSPGSRWDSSAARTRRCSGWTRRCSPSPTPPT